MKHVKNNIILTNYGRKYEDIKQQNFTIRGIKLLYTWADGTWKLLNRFSRQNFLAKPKNWVRCSGGAITGHKKKAKSVYQLSSLHLSTISLLSQKIKISFHVFQVVSLGFSRGEVA